MPEAFDPYRKWLGIPPGERPPNHYRLLGLGLFEDDADAISNAADRQMGHLRTFQSGPHSALSQQLLNELSAARVCLLDPARKAEYDNRLRSSLTPTPAAAPPHSNSLPSNPSPAGPQALVPVKPRMPVAAVRPVLPQSGLPVAGDYGPGNAGPIARPTLRRPAPQKRFSLAPHVGAAVAVAVALLGVLLSLSWLGEEPPLETAAATQSVNEPSPADATPSSIAREQELAPEIAAAGQPAPLRPGNDPAVDDSSSERQTETKPRGADEAETAAPPALPEASQVSAARRQACADLARKLNDFAAWKVLAGQWSVEEGAFRGKGDSRLEFNGELPDDCLLTFRMNVAEGMRPRIFFSNRNFHFGNEGYELNLFVHGEGQKDAAGKPRPYANGEPLDIACRLAGRDVEFMVNGESVVRCRSEQTGPIKLTISGGDFYSPGQTIFRDFRLEPLPPSNANASAPVDLLKLVDPGRDAVLGDWSFAGSSLVTSPLETARLQIPFEPPADYELRIVAQSKVQPTGALFIGLIVGGRQTSIAMDGWNGQTSGMHLLDGNAAAFNSSKREGKAFGDGEPKEIVCTVHPGSVAARCGALTIVEWRGDSAKLSMEPRMEVPNARQLFLAGWDGRFLISKIELTPIPPEPAAAGQPGPPVAAADVRETIPDAALVRDAQRKVESQYQNEWRRAKKLPDRLAVPLKMFAASQFAESMPLRYALLREAADRAAALGDAPTACDALDELQTHFRVDALADQAEAVRQATTKLHDESQAWSAIMIALSLADLAMRKDDLAAADRLVESASMAAKRSGNLAVRAVIQERNAAVGRRKRERERYAEALEKLKASPDDAGANLTAGRYECFYLGRWRDGSSRLEKSSDATLAELARLERAAEQDPSQRAPLAEAWLAAADGAGALKHDYQLEANFWHLQTLANPGAAAAPPAAGPFAAIQGVSLARVAPGLAAALFNGGDFQQEVLQRVDGRIHRNFGFGSPDAKLGGDNFSIRWNGWLKPPLAGKYVLHASADDGFRLWLDGKPILNRWGGAGDEAQEVELTDGLHALKIEYNEYGVTAAVRLMWKLRDQSTEFTVPAAALYHDAFGVAQRLGGS